MSLNIEYNPVFGNLSKVLKELHCVLQTDEQHKKVFSDTPLVGFRNGKSLKNILVRAKLPKMEEPDKQLGCRRCTRANCEVCENLIDAKDFKSTTTGEIFTIEKGPLTCTSHKVVYLVTCKVCAKQNVGSTKNKYGSRFNNYKSVHRRVREKRLGETQVNSNRGRPRKNTETSSNGKSELQKNQAQEKFHHHFCQKGHKGIPDWEIRLIDSATTEKSLRSKELFWQYKLKTFYPDGLNEVEAIVGV